MTIQTKLCRIFLFFSKSSLLHQFNKILIYNVSTIYSVVNFTLVHKSMKVLNMTVLSAKTIETISG